MEEMRMVEFKDGILWFEEVLRDYTEDCFEFSHKNTVILRDRNQYILMFLNKGETEGAYFKDINKKQLKEGVTFNLFSYQPTDCNKSCQFDEILNPVSFVLQINSKKYQMSCNKAKTIEFLEMKTSAENTVDGANCNFLFYKRKVNDQFSMFESVLAQNHYLCSELENGLFKLGLKERTGKIDETTHIEVSVCKSY